MLSRVAAIIATSVIPLHAASEISVEGPEGAPLSTGTVTLWGTLNQVPEGTVGVRSISVGTAFALALKGDRTITAWGSNGNGQLSIPADARDEVMAIATGSSHALVVKTDGTVKAWGYNTSGQTNVPAGLTNVVSVATGTGHALALKADGTVVGWGLNTSSQAAIPAGLSDVVAISASINNSMALKRDGTVVAWGYPGQRDMPAGLSGVRAIACGSSHSLALKENGTVVAWGTLGQGESATIAGLTGVRAISAAISQSMFLMEDGSVIRTGAATTVPAGLGTVREIDMSGNATTGTLAAVRDSEIRMGNFTIGETSPPKTVTIRNDGPDPLHLSGMTVDEPGKSDGPSFTLDTTAITSTVPPGGQTTFSITFSPRKDGLSVGSLKIRSDDADEEVFEIFLSGESKPDIAVFTGSGMAPENERTDNAGLLTFPDTALGGTSEPQTFTIRNNGPGRLTGLAATMGGKFPGDYVVTSSLPSTLSPGEMSTFTVAFSPTGPFRREATILIASNDPDESVFEIPVTGKITAPEITIEDSSTHTILETGKVVGWGRDQYGQTTVPEDAEYGVREISMGDRHTMALKKDGTLWPWGQGANNEPTVPDGIGPVKAIASGIAYNVAIKQDGSLKAWGSNFQGQTNVPSITNAKAVSAGVNHGIVLNTNGAVAGWGNGYVSMYRTNQSTTDVKAISAGYYHNLSLKNNGTVELWGSSTNPRYYTVPGLTNITAVSAGNEYSLALRADGTVWYWPNGVTPVKVPVTGAIAISAGGSHYAVLKNDGTVAAFGDNSYGKTDVPAGLNSVTAIKAGDVNTFAIVDSRLEYGNRALGNASPAKKLLIRNTGNAPLHITSVALVAGDTPDFAIDTTGMLATIPIGGETSFNATFLPVSNGLATATLRLTNNDPDEGYYDIVLSGSSLPEISVSDDAAAELVDDGAPLVFPEKPAGTTGMARTFTITNSREADLSGLTLSLSGTHPADFTVQGPGTSTLAQGESTTFTVLFSPKAGGQRAAVLSIGSNDEDENPFRINLTGHATVPRMSIEQAGAVLDSGNLFAWAGNHKGMGTVPAGLKNVQAISAGGGHNLALKNDGTVVAWGETIWGAADVPAGLTGVKLIYASGGYSVAMKADGSVVSWGTQSPAPASIGGAKDIASYSKFLALNDDGTVNSWGGGFWDSSPLPDGLGDVRAIRTTRAFSLALKNDGTVVCWGNPSALFENQVRGLSGIRAMALGIGDAAFLKNNGTVVAFGINDFGQADVPADLTGVKMIAMASHTCFALKYDGTMVSWGYSGSDWLPVPSGFNGRGVHALSTHAGQILALVSSNIEFGGATSGTSSAAKVFTIHNDGAAPLDLGNFDLSGPDPGDFTIDTSTLPASVPSGGHATFSARFTPHAMGEKSATLRLLSNDPEKNIFNIVLNGTALHDSITPLDAWRLTHFGNSSDEGERALLADYDGDGMSNLLEYALGTLPTVANPPGARPEGGMSSGSFTLTYRRPTGGASGISYDVQTAHADFSGWTTSTPGIDHTQTITQESGGMEKVVITFTTSSTSPRFARISVAY